MLIHFSFSSFDTMSKSVLFAFLVAVIAAAVAAPHDENKQNRWKNFNEKMDKCCDQTNFTRDQIKQGWKREDDKKICSIPEGRKWMNCWFVEWGLITNGIINEEVFTRKLENKEKDGQTLHECVEEANKAEGDVACTFIECLKIKGSDIKYRTWKNKNGKQEEN